MSEALPEGSRFAVLASGSGTNLQALLDAYPRDVAVVAGDRKEAFAFERARKAGVPVEYVNPKDFESREDFDWELAGRVASHDVSLVVGAGYMRVLSAAFLARFPAVLNVHPSLLPEFRGLDAIGRALRAGVCETGVSVHFMVEEVDAGPVVAREKVSVEPGDTEESLLERLHPVEHRLLVGAVADYFWGDPTMTKRALVSVSDKTGVVEFAKGLERLGFEVVSTGRTAKALEEAGVAVTSVTSVTGAPEILGGRVKTLHPKVHGGILADRRNEDHVRQLEEQGIVPIDLVCINLYPFEETVAGGASDDEAVENIDIGGPAMLRAAAKNFHSVIVVPGPELYEEVLAELEGGEVSLDTRRRLALAAFRRTVAYDAAIASWMDREREGIIWLPSDYDWMDKPEPRYESGGLVRRPGEGAEGGTDGGEERGNDFPEQRGDHFPEQLSLDYEKKLPLRYGENPHQRAAYYARQGEDHLLSGTRKLQGKDFSFNNLYDVEAARSLLFEFDAPPFAGRPAAVIIKHANPCGAAVGGGLPEAYRKALASDPLSAFGGIVALNGEIDGPLAGEISKVLTEVLISPGFTPEAREVFASKPSTVLLEAGPLARPPLAAKPVTGGLLLQDADEMEDASEYRLVTVKEPSLEQMSDLLFAWRVAKRVKSNAIVLVKDGATVGVGAGQMSRVDSSGISIRKAGERVGGSVAASDAFFPFADGVEVLAEAGVRAVIQPGGSKRDGEVIEAADKAGVSMVFTGRRHFLH